MTTRKLVLDDSQKSQKFYSAFHYPDCFLIFIKNIYFFSYTANNMNSKFLQKFNKFLSFILNPSKVRLHLKIIFESKNKIYFTFWQSFQIIGNYYHKNLFNYNFPRDQFFQNFQIILHLSIGLFLFNKYLNTYLFTFFPQKLKYFKWLLCKIFLKFNNFKNLHL